jgi:glutamate-1-semialdehyde 2,1-aminomutase
MVGAVAPRPQRSAVTYPDTAEAAEGIYQLVQGPLHRLTAERREAYRAWFDERCGGSASAARRSASFIAGGVQHELVLNEPFPLQIARADGPYVWDVDRNRYVDFVQAGGAALLGNNPPVVREKVAELLADGGPAAGLLHRYEIDLAQLVCELVPGVQRFRMLSSATEAVMAALRMARAFTGKAHVVKVGGAYHGWSDQMMVGLRLPQTGAWEATGIPGSSYTLTHEAYPNDVDGLRELLAWLRRDGGTAAVILEPLGPEAGAHPVRAEYNREVRELCDEFGALLIFDEAVTGFRLGLGGAQEFFGVPADLTIFGNAVAGGYAAAGGVGGRSDVMDGLAGGVTAAGRRPFVGGTLSANPLSCVAGYHSLLETAETDAPVTAGRAGNRLREGLERLIAVHGLPYVTYNYGSIVHLHTSGVLHVDADDPDFLSDVRARKDVLGEMSMAFTAEGMITVAGSRLYTGAAHSDDVVDHALKAFGRAFAGVERVPDPAEGMVPRPRVD